MIYTIICVLCTLTAVLFTAYDIIVGQITIATLAMTYMAIGFTIMAMITYYRR